MKNRPTMMRLLAASTITLAIAACSGEKDPPAGLRPAPVVPTMTPQAVDAGVAAAGSKRDSTKGDQQDSEWVPAEFKKGQARWKDTGVYLDGQPIGFLSWGELPITLKPVWIRDKVSANKRAGTDDPGWRWAQQRFYRFTDYLKALRIDVRKVKALHIYGPRFSNSIVLTNKDLQLPVIQKLLFRFGASVAGKAIPHVPEGFGTVFGSGNPADKIASVMIYIEKTPPELVPNEGFVLNGNLQEGVPYFGDPIRGGIRIYLDDRYAGIIKRQDLDPKQATKGADGELAWSLPALLAAQGIDTSKVVELWTIRGENRTERLPASELPGLTFQANAQAKGGVLLGEKKLLTNTIALHTRAIQPDELPFITPDDQ